MQVVDEGMGKNEGADELLSAFNVATFKSAEDDKAFWNRLIPAGERTADEKKTVRSCFRTSFFPRSTVRALARRYLRPHYPLRACREMPHSSCHIKYRSSQDSSTRQPGRGRCWAAQA